MNLLCFNNLEALIIQLIWDFLFASNFFSNRQSRERFVNLLSIYN